MTDQTLVTQPAVTQTIPLTDPAKPKPKQPRQLVRFTFYKLDQHWQLLPIDVRERGKQQLKDIVNGYEQHALIRSYGLYGLRSDCDFMLWQATADIEELRLLSRQIR